MSPRERFLAISAAVNAGAEVGVVAVVTPTGQAVVRWGVEGVAVLEYAPGDARSVADLFDNQPGYAAIAPLLRDAADLCDAHRTVVH